MYHKDVALTLVEEYRVVVGDLVNRRGLGNQLDLAVQMELMVSLK